AGRASRIALSDQVASARDRGGRGAGVGHRQRLPPRPPSARQPSYATLTPATRKLSLAAARRIALAAQGFDRPRPRRPPDASQIVRLVQRLGVLQLDSVNVFMRAHYMPVFSRLGSYDRSRLD